MKIKFLKNCSAPQRYVETCGDGCCSNPVWEVAYFMVGEEADPEEFWHEIELSGLQYRVDYDIVEYP